jgi:hypothetical protein
MGVGEPATLGNRWMISPMKCWIHGLDEATAHALAVEAVEFGHDPRCLSEKIP